VHGLSVGICDYLRVANWCDKKFLCWWRGASPHGDTRSDITDAYNGLSILAGTLEWATDIHSVGTPQPKVVTFGVRHDARPTCR
jgi:hypothetical protein